MQHLHLPLRRLRPGLRAAARDVLGAWGRLLGAGLTGFLLVLAVMRLLPGAVAEDPTTRELARLYAEHDCSREPDPTRRQLLIRTDLYGPQVVPLATEPAAAAEQDAWLRAHAADLYAFCR